jgi:hypothetical protein
MIDTVPLPEGTRRPDELPTNQNPDGFPSPGECTAGFCGTDEDPDMSAGGAVKSIEGSYIYHVSFTYGVLIAGTVWSMPGAGQVNLIDRPRQIAATVPSNGDGSFVAMMGVPLGTTLELAFFQGGELVDEGELTLAEASYATYEANGDLDDGFSNGYRGETAPQADVASLTRSGNNVVIQGYVASFNPAIFVVAVNPARRTVGRGRASDDGYFSLSLAATSGDTLFVFAVEPAYSNGAGEALELTAP